MNELFTLLDEDKDDQLNDDEQISIYTLILSILTELREYCVFFGLYTEKTTIEKLQVFIENIV